MAMLLYKLMPGYKAPKENVIDHHSELKSAKSILICMPFGFNEFQSALGLLKSIVDKYAKREIAIVTSWSYRNWLENFRNQKIISISEEKINFLKLPKKPLIKYLKSKNFEVAIDLNPGGTLFSSILCAATGAKVRVGFTGENSDRFFNFQVKPISEDTSENQFDALLNYIS